MTTRINYRYLFSVIMLIVLAIASLVFQQKIKTVSYQIVKPNIASMLIIVSAVIDFAHRFKYNRLSFNINATFSNFKASLEGLASCVQNPLTLTCTYSLLRALCLQYFYKEKHFMEFNELELTFIFIATAFLFLGTLSEHTKLFRETILETETPTNFTTIPAQTNQDTEQPS